MACSLIVQPQLRTAPHPHEQVLSLFRAWQDDADQQAREALVLRYTPLARSLARRYRRSSEPFEDLLQVAMLGLVNAIDRFDPNRGTGFASFAVPTILGEMRRYFRDSGWAMHMPRSLQERALKVSDAQERLARANGRAPTVNELATFLELSVEEINEALQAERVYDVMSLDAPRIGEEGELPTFAESIGDADGRYEMIELDATISGAIGQLSKYERRILHSRFVEELTQTQIAQRVGISQMQVSRLLRRSLQRLRVITDA